MSGAYGGAGEEATREAWREVDDDKRPEAGRDKIHDPRRRRYMIASSLSPPAWIFVPFPTRALSLPAWILPDSHPNHGGLAPALGRLYLHS